jgi:hypothetical protein
LPIVVRSTESVTVEGRHPEDKEWFQAMLFADLDRGALETIRRPGKGIMFPAKNTLQAISHQWTHGFDRQKREHFWINAETGERRFQQERPADLTDEELDQESPRPPRTDSADRAPRKGEHFACPETGKPCVCRASQLGPAWTRTRDQRIMSPPL